MYKNLGDMLMNDTDAKKLYLSMADDEHGRLELHSSQIHTKRDMIECLKNREEN